MPKIFRRFAPNRWVFFIFIENLQNFGRGFLIEGGGFNFNSLVLVFPVERRNSFLLTCGSITDTNREATGRDLSI